LNAALLMKIRGDYLKYFFHGLKWWVSVESFFLESIRAFLEKLGLYYNILGALQKSW